MFVVGHKENIFCENFKRWMARILKSLTADKTEKNKSNRWFGKWENFHLRFFKKSFITDQLEPVIPAKREKNALRCHENLNMLKKIVPTDIKRGFKNIHGPKNHLSLMRKNQGFVAVM